MNQKNGKNLLGIDKCFEDLENPIDLFNKWFAKAKENEINDPNALALATSDKNYQPTVRMVLLKDYDNQGFVFYTNFNSRKGTDLKNNKKASMCFHWKSIRRQIRIIGTVEKVSDNEADKYFSSRPYKNKISAWASSQSEVLQKREDLLIKFNEFKKKYPSNDVPRPPHWSGWKLAPSEIEFWNDGEGRVHERLNYKFFSGKWFKELLNP